MARPPSPLWTMFSVFFLLFNCHLLVSISYTLIPQSAGRAAGWAKEFDSLLSDPSGLARFTEFLQQEFR